MTLSSSPALHELAIELLIFDFDGTLVDSDDALMDPFLLHGIKYEDVIFGSAVKEECDRLGIPLEAYVEAYDTSVVQPFDGVAELVAQLPRWAICSNKHPDSGTKELARLGWQPEVVQMADAFDWHHKHLGPILDAVGLEPSQVAMVGDSPGDARCAEGIGCPMIWVGWNERVNVDPTTNIVAHHPLDLLKAYQ